MTHDISLLSRGAFITFQVSAGARNGVNYASFTDNSVNIQLKSTGIIVTYDGKQTESPDAHNEDQDPDDPHPPTIPNHTGCEHQSYAYSPSD